MGAIDHRTIDQLHTILADNDNLRREVTHLKNQIAILEGKPDVTGFHHSLDCPGGACRIHYNRQHAEPCPSGISIENSWPDTPAYNEYLVERNDDHDRIIDDACTDDHLTF